MVMVAAGLALAGCGAASTTGSTTSPSTTGASHDPSAEALAAYRGMWSDLVSAARTSNYQSPQLAEHATGDALTLFTQGLARDQLHDIVTRGSVLLHPTVTSLSPAQDPTRAQVSDCVDDEHWVEYTTSGRRAKNPPGGRRATTATLAQQHGVWKVDQLTVGKVDSC